MTITLAVVAALQSVVIAYGLQKHYEFWSRTWAVAKMLFNVVKSKLERKETKVEKEKEKSKDIRLKVRKSSFKRLANTIINSVAKTCN